MKLHHPLTFSNQALRWLLPLLIAAGPGLAGAEPLSLDAAEALALSQDPAVRSIESRRQALEELSVAAGQLPDPMLKVGAVGLPTDSFHLGQEPMTQLQLGVTQKFPRGESRALRADQLGQRSRGLDEVARDQELRIVLAVRENYLEVLKQIRLARINDEAISVFTDLADITQDYYATGRVPQQDVLRASVELSRVRDRAERIYQAGERARAQLAAWIGDAALRDFPRDWPELEEPAPTIAIKDRLAHHPRILALHQQVIAAETGVDLARQNYKPEFSVDLTYGGRAGTSPDGSSRTDLLSVMVMMDVPLFTAKRQDRTLAARVAESSAAMYGRDDVYRQMRSQVDLHTATLRRERQRLELFESTLLPEASFNAEATFDAYQAAVEDLTTLMRARIIEFELQLEYARLQADALKTEARLLYLEGEPHE